MSSQALPTTLATETRERASWHAGRIEFPAFGIATYETGRTDDAAPVLVLVHGMGHWTQAAWGLVAAGFEATHRIVAFDLPGFGASDKPQIRYTLGLYTAVLRAVVRRARAERFALAGHSLGGLIAANYAARFPEDVHHLTLIDPAGFLRTPTLALRVMGSRAAMRLIGSLRPSEAFIVRTLRSAVFDPASLPPDDVELAIARGREPATTRAFARVYAGAMQELVHMKTLHARFAGRTAPTLLVWGRQDAFVPVRALATARAVYPRADVLEIDRCGHCPNIEYPAEVTARMRATGA